MSGAHASFADTDLPALHRAAGKLAADAQREHLRGNQLLLLLLLAGALIPALTPATELLHALMPAPPDSAATLIHGAQQLCALLAAIALAGGLWLTALLRTTKKAEAWYDGRAVAESAKSMAWKYMMGVGPYDFGTEASAIDALFCGDLTKLLTDIKGHPLPGATPGDGGQITVRMREIRARGAAERLAIYLPARLVPVHRVLDRLPST